MAEKVLTAVIQEAYIQGISTRTVDDLAEAMGMDELLPVRWTRSLSRRLVSLELRRAEIAGGRVASTWVVELLDVIKYVGPVPGAIYFAGGPLGFQRGEEAFHRRVVPDIARSAHAASDTMIR